MNIPRNDHRNGLWWMLSWRFFPITVCVILEKNVGHRISGIFSSFHCFVCYTRDTLESYISETNWDSSLKQMYSQENTSFYILRGIWLILYDRACLQFLFKLKSTSTGTYEGKFWELQLNVTRFMKIKRLNYWSENYWFNIVFAYTIIRISTT